MIKNILSKNRIVQYDICGKGLPVVLIHGFAEDHTIWNHQISFLEKKHLVISIDIPGSGGSECLMNNEADLSDFTIAIKDVLLKENITACVMLGHSMGGYITLAYQKKYQSDLLGIGLIHSTAFIDTEERKAIRKKSISFIEENGSLAFLKTSLPGLFFESDKHKENLDEILKFAGTDSNQVLIQYYHAIMKRPLSTEILTQLKIPLLMIAGKHDQVIPLNDLLYQSHVSNVTYFHIMTASAHMGMIEEPNRVNNIIDDFLDNITKITSK